MNWIVLFFALQIGYTPNDNIVQYNPPPIVWSQNSMIFINMDAELRFVDNHIYIGGNLGVPTWILQGGATSGITLDPGGFPANLQSVIRAGVRFGGIEIGWSHLCTHPVMPFQPLVGEQTNWEGGYDEIHIRFSGSVKLF